MIFFFLKDIRNYFSVLGKNKDKVAKRENHPEPTNKLSKKKRRILDSDDEDPCPPRKVSVVDVSDSGQMV